MIETQPLPGNSPKTSAVVGADVTSNGAAMRAVSENLDVDAAISTSESARLSVAVVIATLGRPDLVRRMIADLQQQTQQPDLLLFSVTSTDDLPDDFVETEGVQVVFGPKGLPAQRNTAIERIGRKFDVIVFYDDDFIPSRRSVENIGAFFASHSDVVGACGVVLADGINNAGIGEAEAKRIVDAHDDAGADSNSIIRSLHGLYGCNMAYRVEAIGRTRFDERLKLYGWQEDIDFAASLRDRGRIVQSGAFAGVHQGVKHGRTPGKRLGYSQIINPAYLVRKGTMRPAYALKIMVRNLVSNHMKLLRPEPWVDRKGRALGNWIGILDLLRGALTPERIERL